MHPTGKPTGYGPSSRRSHNRGIVDECCFQSCELRRLEMYCAPVKTGKTPRSLRAQRHIDSPRTGKRPTSGHSHTSCKRQATFIKRTRAEETQGAETIACRRQQEGEAWERLEKLLDSGK
ncbi:hypothetical protein DNTS_020204 [Danionella cerebrum]|uniref:Insulin-like domain-containing protein n=1 Tax=Danionella cerebrum TaxID=2873325 RepID=A0A553NA10_9TELE|nr:hypothetical protein DNTS_020204 [Danionella translucida]